MPIFNPVSEYQLRIKIRMAMDNRLTMTNVSITAVQSRKSRKDIILDKLFDGYLTLDTKEMEKEVLSWKGKVS
jgi:hypothetical protein